MHHADIQAVIYGHAEQHRGDRVLEAWHRNTGRKLVTCSNHDELLCFFRETHLKSISGISYAHSGSHLLWHLHAISDFSLAVILPGTTLHQNIHWTPKLLTRRARYVF